MAQTVVKDSRAIRFGSAKFEVGESLATMVDLGAMNGVKFTEEWETVKVNADNAGQIFAGIRNHQASIEGEMLEVTLADLALLRGGTDLYTTVAATPVTSASQTVSSGSWSFNGFIPITNQNGNGGKITPTSVTGSVDGALTLAVDYDLVEVNGVWGIAITDSVAVTTEAQNISIVYDYTPAAAKKFTSGGMMTINPRVVRVTNTDASGKRFMITVFKATNEQGIELEFQPDDAEDPNSVAIKLTGVCDTSKAPGAQLFEIYDEQAV